jgi:hypothetical protein
MTVASCRVLVAMRDLIAIIHPESRIPSQRTRMDLFWRAADREVAFESGLQTPEV